MSTSKQDERILALCEGRPVGEVCPNISSTHFGGMHSCKLCNGTGCIHTQPEGEVELAVAKLHAEYLTTHATMVYFSVAESMRRERDTAQAMAANEHAKFLDALAIADRSQAAAREACTQRDAAQRELAEARATLRNRESDCMEHGVDLANMHTKAREALARAERAEADSRITDKLRAGQEANIAALQAQRDRLAAALRALVHRVKADTTRMCELRLAHLVEQAEAALREGTGEKPV